MELARDVKIQGGTEKILLETVDSFVANSNFCEPPCILLLLGYQTPALEIFVTA